MDETAIWNELTRFEQRALIKLFGGGTLRSESPAVSEALCARGLVDENGNLSMPGLLILTLAIRKQQADTRSRMGLAAWCIRDRPGQGVDTFPFVRVARISKGAR